MCVTLSQISSCVSCVSNSSSFSWCSSPKSNFCFTDFIHGNQSTTGNCCPNGVIVSSKDLNIIAQCNALNQNQTQLMITLIILIIIPFIVVIGCICVLMYRSRMQMDNKVEPGMEEEYIEQPIDEPMILFRPQSNPFLAEIHGDNIRQKIPDYPTASASVREPPITAEAKIISDDSKIEDSGIYSWSGSLTLTNTSSSNFLSYESPSEISVTGRTWERALRGLYFSTSTSLPTEFRRSFRSSFSLFLTEHNNQPVSSSSPSSVSSLV